RSVDGWRRRVPQVPRRRLRQSRPVDRRTWLLGVGHRRAARQPEFDSLRRRPDSDRACPQPRCLADSGQGTARARGFSWARGSSRRIGSALPAAWPAWAPACHPPRGLEGTQDRVPDRQRGPASAAETARPRSRGSRAERGAWTDAAPRLDRARLRAGRAPHAVRAGLPHPLRALDNRLGTRPDDLGRPERDHQRQEQRSRRRLGLLARRSRERAAQRTTPDRRTAARGVHRRPPPHGRHLRTDHQADGRCFRRRRSRPSPAGALHRLESRPRARARAPERVRAACGRNRHHLLNARPRLRVRGCCTEWHTRLPCDEFHAARRSHGFEATGRRVVRRRVRDERAASAIEGGEVSTFVTRPFRFGVVCPLMTDLRAWRDRVRRIADSGYSTLLMPDVPGCQPAPGPTLALAAELAEIRVGTWVYASPVRPAWTTAWEAHSLSVLSEGRFEMGIGLGRPGIEDQLRELGLPVVPRAERLAQVRDTVTALRQLDGPDLHTPVVMAVRGPKGRALAADLADTVTFVAMADDPGIEIARLARDFRGLRDDVELALHVPVVGDTVAPFMTAPDTDPAALRAIDS